MTTINDEAHEIQSPDERLVDDKNDDNNKAFAAQDNMDNNTSKSDDQDDEVEEGELPEDGEIMDDDDAGVDASIDSPRTHQKSAHEALVAADKCRSVNCFISLNQKEKRINFAFKRVFRNLHVRK